MCIHFQKCWDILSALNFRPFPFIVDQFSHEYLHLLEQIGQFQHNMYGPKASLVLCLKSGYWQM